MIHIVPVHQVDQVWPLVAKGMIEACENGGGDVTPSWLWGLCRRGEALLFLVIQDEAIKASFVCQVQDWPSGQVLRFLVCSGEDMASWLPKFREFCGTFNVKRVVFGGRKGWGRVIKGARLLHQTFELDLTDAGY